jgi:hypothetical protein
MPPTPPPQGRVRSAAELNAAIRAFWMGPGGHPTLPLTDVQRAEYQALIAELERVERGDVTTAA